MPRPASSPWAPSAQAIAHHGPFVAHAIAHFRRPRIPADTRFALIRKPLEPLEKPVAFETLAQLVAAIHRERGDAGLQMFDAEIHVFGEDEPRQGVSLFATEEGDSARYLGWVYLEGRGVHALRRALDVARPDVPVIGMAA
ncbi:hypothetical protein [Caulobacter sp. DWR3-1-2]|uniref:hypothetical protein n=1 Tax=Caulobacter sp. DWR3-1-2 TaxID=2804647 RepID=UPI003CE75244